MSYVDPYLFSKGNEGESVASLSFLFSRPRGWRSAGPAVDKQAQKAEPLPVSGLAGPRNTHPPLYTREVGDRWGQIAIVAISLEKKRKQVEHLDFM